MDIATVGVASVVSLAAQSDVCQEVKIALGAVAPTVVRATSAEALLRGQPVDAERLQQVAHAAAQAHSTHPADVLAPARWPASRSRSFAAGTSFSQRLTATVATPLPMRLVIARHSLMKRSKDLSKIVES